MLLYMLSLLNVHLTTL